jgi:hypothetical protein
MCADIMIGFPLLYVIKTYIKVPSIRTELLAVIISKFTPVGPILRVFFKGCSILCRTWKTAYFHIQIIVFKMKEKLSKFIDNTEY